MHAPSTTNVIDMMVQLLGDDEDNAMKQVEKTYGAHAHFSWLRQIFKEHVREAFEAEEAGHIPEMQ